MELAGYFAAVLIGISLGLVGAGGSILTVPLLIYFFRLPVLVATSYSLFIVGSTSLVGALNKTGNFKTRKISSVIVFCILSATTVLLIRKYVLQQIPENFRVLGIHMEFPQIMTVSFALLMILASRPLTAKENCDSRPRTIVGYSFYKLSFCAFVVGTITGFLGAGGGFLIVPALIFILAFEMKEAISTSLMIIAINSMVGFGADFGTIPIKWNLLSCITIAAVVGVFAGRAIAKQTSSEKLRRLFGWFILLIGSAMLAKEVLAFILKFR